MNHNRGTETRFVGEDTALKTHLYGNANAAADNSGRGERKLEYRNDDIVNKLDVDKEDNQSADYVHNAHNGNELFRNGGNALDTADGNQSGNNGEENADDPGGNIELGVHVACNGVCLSEVTYTEGSDNGKYGEQNCKNLTDGLKSLFPAKTVLQVVHSAACPLAFFIFSAVEHAENVFGVVCHHSEEC